MKKYLLGIFAILLMLNPSTSKAQSFEKGNVLLNPGINYGNRIIGNTFFRPNFSFSVDIGVHDYVSVGPYTGIAFGGNSNNAFTFGGRANFHWWQLLDDKVDKDLKQDQFELFYTVWLGGAVVNNGNGGFDAGTTLGLRWYPNANNRFALFSEWGRGPVSWGTIGATIKIN